MVARLFAHDPGVVLVLALVVHGIGDFVAQTPWMARRKPESWPAAVAHVAVYTVVFLLITLSPLQLAAIAGTHLLIDRFVLAKQLIRLRNQCVSRARRPVWAATADTGFADGTDAVTAALLVTAVDQVLHVGMNSVALVWL
ncbi:MAG TPA: DUF3307 domain-containing protein [Stackebrandtia sp.]|jgi:hypothetical protein|uniref:DUF3307 domain-containing protein n=1 Tax=Stackebrandtia sp. TaxID=2023065 RepID=UPI002D3741EE|nr:DUF3307 domain-containing protein [Stackebrandtia sp.]HZE37819.1 DUF3307 domain-containing protein [Stackebrandtia sp.]